MLRKKRINELRSVHFSEAMGGWIEGVMVHSKGGRRQGRWRDGIVALWWDWEATWSANLFNLVGRVVLFMWALQRRSEICWLQSSIKLRSNDNSSRQAWFWGCVVVLMCVDPFVLLITSSWYVAPSFLSLSYAACYTVLYIRKNYIPVHNSYIFSWCIQSSLQTNTA